MKNSKKSWFECLLTYVPFRSKKKVVKVKKKGKKKVEKVMKEFKEGTLHGGSKKGPEVTNKSQAVAIALSEARKAGAKIPKKGKK